jgi:hypothetical protein
MKSLLAVSVLLTAVLLIGAAASRAQAQMHVVSPMMAPGWGRSEPPSGQPSMTGGGTMGQGMCRVCAMSEQTDPMEMMEMIGMMSDGHMNPKTRGWMLQLQGEMLEAMAEAMIKYG